MPLYYQQNINDTTKLAVWKIEENDDFFLEKVSLHLPVTHPHKRLQHLAGRYLLPFLFTDFPVSLIEIADTRKPFLPKEQYHFSISHSGDYAAAIVSSTHRVGIDAEMVTDRVKRIIQKFVHQDELDSLHHLSGSKLIEQLTILWGAKEAMFKWWGRGDIDFSEVMRTQYFELSKTGTINARFQKNELNHLLQLNYRLYDALSLVWVVE
ncbi:MAG: 4'-phosphopantetheinyl transferase superfamily protein [Leadbetterella sp.]|nr:4'-phosphopantetheinyl transferase superfamily protein [Leadbetterella sp.]